MHDATSADRSLDASLGLLAKACRKLEWYAAACAGGQHSVFR